MGTWELRSIIVWVGYCLLAFFISSRAQGVLRKRLLLAVNAVGYGLLFLFVPEGGVVSLSALALVLSLFSSYWILVFCFKKRAFYYLAILWPFSFFFAFRLCPSVFFLIGQAFLAIRLSYAAFESCYRLRAVPALFDYLSYALFLPTAGMGPVTPFSSYLRSVGEARRPHLSLDLACRFSFGLVKAYVLSSLFFTAAFNDENANILIEFHELLIAGLIFYVALYTKLSGFYDMAISVSQTLGIHTVENFNYPLLSRNIQDHWRRWHISILNYFREVYFFPLSIFFQRLMGRRFEIPILVVLTFFIFTLIAIWHGFEMGYFYFAWLHALGVSTVILFDRLLRKTPETFRTWYRKSLVTYGISWFVTLLYIGLTYIFYEQTELFYYYWIVP